jgi:membrane peptidoglycan carboxypeptidase
MADNPSNPNDQISDERHLTGGWRKPQAASSTQTAAPARVSAQLEGWRVPTLPTNMPTSPAREGQWHRPRPEDTVFTEKDITEISPERQQVIQSRPEDILLSYQAESPGEVDTADQLTPTEFDGIYMPEPEAAPLDSRSLLEIELEPQTAEEAEEDSEGFSMSELIALSSLVEKMPKTDIVPKKSATGQQTAGESQSLAQTGTEAPADYARRQLEILTGSSGLPAEPSPAAQSAVDPAAYARQQLSQLGEGPSATARPTLAQRFRDTETQVRALRARYQNGELTREQLQDQLKKLMILDENQVWWMMGVETDTWYRFENNQWVVATPPYFTPSAPQQRTPVPTETQGLDPSEVIAGSLPYFPSEQIAAQDYTQPSEAYRTSGFGITEELGLPRTNIPIQDPDRTMVGQMGYNLTPVRPTDAQTLPTLQRVPEQTVVNPAVNVGYTPGAEAGFGEYGGPATPGAIPTDPYAAPDYGVETAAPTFEEVARRSQQQTVRTLLTLAALGIGALILLTACGIGFFLMQYNNMASQWQPQIAALRNYQPVFQTVRVLDTKGGLIAELNSPEGGARTDVPLNRISPFMIHAVVSLENERFFEDPGWDWVAIFRAFIQNITAGQVESGASTITQQIAEQLVLKQRTTTPNLKLQEIIIASEIAKQYSKQEILRFYLNEIYFGNQSYGVEAASQFYFNVSANDLNLPQAAMLAAMIANPSQYNPVRSGVDDAAYGQRRDATLARMDLTIQRMRTVGCLTFQTGAQPFCVNDQVVRQASLDIARLKAQEFKPREFRSKYPHFVQYVTQQVDSYFGEGEMYRRGFVIKTTLNPAIQDAAETALDQAMATLINTGINTGSVMVTDPRTGAIRAMVGSPNFNDESIKGQVNGALTFQQPGSSIKPVVYAAALEGVDQTGDGRADSYYTPATILWDVDTTFAGGYRPVNFDGQFHGPLPLRYALQRSYNIAAIKTYQFIGDAKFQDIARRMGLHFAEGAQFNLTTGIGSTDVTLYDMMSAFGTLANSGVRATLFGIESVTDAQGNAIVLPERAAPTQALQPQIAFLMNHILSDDPARSPAFPTNGNLTIPGIPTQGYVAAKTGTTNDARDLWTMGYTMNAVVGVWLGHPDNNPTAVRDGGYGSAAPLWRTVMTAALGEHGSPSPFPNPPGLVQQQVCTDTGTQPPQNCPSGLRTELFVQGQPPPSADQAFVLQLVLDSWSGLRANEFCNDPDSHITSTVLNLTDDSARNWLFNTALGQQYATRLGITSNTQTTTPPAACDQNTEVPIAAIRIPANGATVNGSVTVIGAATAASFQRFDLEYAPIQSNGQIGTLVKIVTGSTQPVPSGQLGLWNTTLVPNGNYILQLTMFSTSGGHIVKRAQVNVNNVAVVPTAETPVTIPGVITLLPGNGSQGVATLPPAGGGVSTPLPFDEVTPAP